MKCNSMKNCGYIDVCMKTIVLIEKKLEIITVDILDIQKLKIYIFNSIAIWMLLNLQSNFGMLKTINIICFD